MDLLNKFAEDTSGVNIYDTLGVCYIQPTDLERDIKKVMQKKGGLKMIGNGGSEDRKSASYNNYTPWMTRLR